MKVKGPQATAPTAKAIAERLKLLRESLGLSQTDMASLVGTSCQAWNNFERGRRRISVDQATKVCEKAGASLDWIYYGKLRSVATKIQTTERELHRTEPSEPEHGQHPQVKSIFNDRGTNSTKTKEATAPASKREASSEKASRLLTPREPAARHLTRYISVRVSPAMGDALELMAKQRLRSVPNLVAKILADHLRNRGYLTDEGELVLHPANDSPARKPARKPGKRQRAGMKPTGLPWST
jgi:transcriptional regulator with XRE-family HTH domain